MDLVGRNSIGIELTAPSAACFYTGAAPFSTGSASGPRRGMLRHGQPFTAHSPAGFFRRRMVFKRVAATLLMPKCVHEWEVREREGGRGVVRYRRCRKCGVAEIISF